MRNILLILFALPLLSMAQFPATISVSTVNNLPPCGGSKDTFELGQKLTLSIRVDSGSAGAGDTVFLNLVYATTNSPYYIDTVVIYNGHWNYLQDSLPPVTDPLCPNWNKACNRLLSFNIPDTLPECNIKFMTKTDNCNFVRFHVKAKPTGIDEYHPVGSVIRSEYYDFLGRKITPKDQTIVIRVDHYSNGYTAARKYFYTYGR